MAYFIAEEAVQQLLKGTAVQPQTMVDLQIEMAMPNVCMGLNQSTV